MVMSGVAALIACHYRGWSRQGASPLPTSRIAARIAAITESATLAVDAKAKALRAAGEPVIGFGAGEPDFPTPPHIVEAAIAAASDPRNHRYTPAAGLPELREAIAVKTKRDSGYDVGAGQAAGSSLNTSLFETRCIDDESQADRAGSHPPVGEHGGRSRR